MMTGMPTPDLHDTIRARLAEAGQRYTRRRRELVEFLVRTGNPVAIPQILRARKLAQSSVYRNLGELERAGVVRRVSTEDEHGRYELAEDLTEHHHHLMCSSCGRVEDLLIPPALERSLERTLDGVARSAGFAEVDHRLDLIGVCSDCASTSSGR
jgi:Fe2+ or Zn2+ uptake regulation protein